MKRSSRDRNIGWLVVEVLGSAPFPPRPDEVRVRVTEVDGQTFTAMVHRAGLLTDEQLLEVGNPRAAADLMDLSRDTLERQDNRIPPGLV